jgi:hypothetical protein
MRGWVFRLQLLLALASAVIVRPESRGTHDHILLSQIRDSTNLEGQVSVLISWGTGWPGYTPRHWVSFSPSPRTRWATVEVFDPASKRDARLFAADTRYIASARTPQKTPPNSYSIVTWRSCRHVPRKEHRLPLFLQCIVLHSCYLRIAVSLAPQYWLSADMPHYIPVRT